METLFKSKEEAQKAFEKMGLEYPKYSSGANEGKIKGTLSQLSKLYDLEISKQNIEEKPKEINKVENSEEVINVESVDKEEEESVVTETNEDESFDDTEKVVTSKPNFHRGRPKRFNAMSFKKY